MDDNWDAQKMLDMYILDYMRKKNMHTTAEIFAKEADVSDKPVVINPPEGFLKEWWDMFYDVFISTTQKGTVETKAESSLQANTGMGSNLIPNACPTIPRPGMIQIGDLIHNVPPAATTPKQLQQPTDMNQLLMMMGQFSNSSLSLEPGGLMQREPPPAAAAPSPMLQAAAAAAAQMHDNEQLQRLRLLQLPPPRDMIPTPLLDLDKLTRMLPPSAGSSSRLQQQAPHKTPQQVARENRRAINLGRSNIPRNNPASYGTPKALRTRLDSPADAGKNKGVILTASKGWPLVVSHIPPYASASSKNGSNPTSVPDDSSWKDLIGGLPVQQRSEQQVGSPVTEAAEHIMISTTQAATQHQEDLLNVQCHSEDDLSGKDAGGDVPMDENVESFLSQDGEADHLSTVFPHVDHHSSLSGKIEQQGFSLSEFCCLRGTKNKLLCCHFSSQGKLLASAGHDRKVLVWNLETYASNTMEGHSSLVTDIRFRPNSTIFATSSFDRSVQIWDASRPKGYLFKLTGHDDHVTSLDFHPKMTDLLCSCDSNDEIRMWNINHCSCRHIFKGASRRVRFQPRLGDLLAAATGNIINLIDVETSNVYFKLEGHKRDVRSICWDISGKYFASVSEDCACIWSTVLGGKCIHELRSSGNKFESCTFHPGYTQLLVIGCYQSLELWNPTERNRTWTCPAHTGMISSLEASPETEVIASASHDQLIKLWK